MEGSYKQHLHSVLRLQTGIEIYQLHQSDYNEPWMFRRSSTRRKTVLRISEEPNENKK